jgi:hypothetical protein
MAVLTLDLTDSDDRVVPLVECNAIILEPPEPLGRRVHILTAVVGDALAPLTITCPLLRPGSSRIGSRPALSTDEASRSWSMRWIVVCVPRFR